MARVRKIIALSLAAVFLVTLTVYAGIGDWFTFKVRKNGKGLRKRPPHKKRISGTAGIRRFLPLKNTGTNQSVPEKGTIAFTPIFLTKSICTAINRANIPC